MPGGARQGRMHGFQLWANLPADLKMTRPRYQDVAGKDIPEVTDDDGTRVRVICGTFWGKTGPIDGVAADPRYLDVCVPGGRRKTLPVDASRHPLAYLFEGAGTVRYTSAPAADAAGATAAPASPPPRWWCGGSRPVGPERTARPCGGRGSVARRRWRAWSRGAARRSRAQSATPRGRAAPGAREVASRRVAPAAWRVSS